MTIKLSTAAAVAIVSGTTTASTDTRQLSGSLWICKWSSVHISRGLHLCDPFAIFMWRTEVEVWGSDLKSKTILKSNQPPPANKS